ncbi:MAG: NB-ARC domain-containing protein [Actinomycetota bacterium]|nr:NB-ARC domain-containing protein [Actinomycetota bacterium]
MRRGDRVEFRILGSLEIAVGPERLELGGVREQVVLAMLLLNANTVVTVDRLLEALYGEDLPPTSRSQAQITISSLRRLFASHGHTAVVSTRAAGYVIEAGTGGLDSERFEDLAAAARAARDAGHLDRAVAGYRDALRLWRGPALDGLDSLLIRAAASRLDEQRIGANEDRLTLELDLGRHHELVGELTELTEQYPLRERLRGQLMLALYRCDRTAEALQVYRQARRAMIDELGIEPGERLQQLERAILTCDPALDPPAGPVTIQPATRQIPSLLPIDIADFTGRAEQIEQIGQRLTRAAGPGSQLPVPVVVITGQGGVGKTSTAVHAAHGTAGQFRDGQLFADLHGWSAHPVGPMHVLERFLRALGVPGPQIPESLDERAEVYRSLLAGRRILVVLDDAVGESQVAPLLPGSGGAAVLVTSRSRLSGLPGATHIRMNVLDADQSLDLLARIAGTDRVEAQSQAAAAVAAQCGHLPLALRIAGARLAARPHRSFQQLADRLTDETRRLDELTHGDMGIRASISLSYDSVSDKARRLFRRLAVLEQPVFSGWMGAALLDVPPAEAEDLLDDLVLAQLVQATGTETGVHSHYRFHELIRVFARERLAAEEPAAEQKAAAERALGALLYLAEEASRRYEGGADLQLDGSALRWPLSERLVDQLLSDPLLWFERERAALVSGVRQAARAGLAGLCWSLSYSTASLFETRAYFDDCRETADGALQAARQAHDVRGQAAMLHYRGALQIQQQQFDDARRDHEAAAQLFQGIGDDQGFALSIRNIAFLDNFSGRLGDAARGYDQALTILRKTGDQVNEAHVLENLAMIKLNQHQPGEARALLADALRLARAAHHRRVEAQVLYLTGEADLREGELARAVGSLDEALAIVRATGDPVGEARILQAAGVAKIRQGEFAQARITLLRALELAGIIGERMAEGRTLLGLSELALTTGDPGQAVARAQQAFGIFRGMGAPLYEERALTLLSDAHAALGDSAAAAAVSADVAALRATLADKAR